VETATSTGQPHDVDDDVDELVKRFASKDVCEMTCFVLSGTHDVNEPFRRYLIRQIWIRIW